ncbi:MAG: hypothetical protein OXD34_15445 [bacterium]|nr:hypothetical protein [bacterium]
MSRQNERDHPRPEPVAHLGRPAYNLIEHLCRLITVSVRTVRIVDRLPPSLPPDDPRPAD